MNFKDALKFTGLGLGVVTIIIGGVVIAKKIKENKEKKQSGLLDLEKEIKESEKQIPLSYEKSWYKTSADQLKAAMDGPGTDERTIFNIISSLKNINDWRQLYFDFGKRDISWGKDNIDLTTALAEDLSNSDRDIATKHLNKIGVDIKI